MDVKVRGKRRKPFMKRFFRRKHDRLKKTCFADKSVEELIFHDAQGIGETADTLESVHYTKASSPHSRSSSPPQARRSDPLDQLMSAKPLSAQSCSPIGFHSNVSNDPSPNHPRGVHLEETPKISRNIPSVEVPLEEFNISSNNLMRSGQLAAAEPFMVSDMEFVLETSGDTPCEVQSVSEAGAISTLTVSTETCTGNLKTRLKNSLPSSWRELSHLHNVNSHGNPIVLCKCPVGPCLVIQRQINIYENGSVELFVHHEPLRSNHEIWAKLPQKISLATSSVDDCHAYVLAVVNLVHSYDICLGCPLPEEQDMARKMGAIFCPNKFRETRYITTHRSINCEILVIIHSKVTACSACKIMKRNIRKRLARNPSTASPKLSN